MNNTNTEGEGFSSIDYVHQCLLDNDKAEAFEAAIKELIKPSSNILELGTGTGILSLIASRAGGNKITAIEFDPFIADVARQNIENNHQEHKIKVVTADARNIKFINNEKFDLVLMEMLCTALIEEMQVQAINNLHSQHIISAETMVIPFAQENYIELAHTDFMNHGFEMKMIKYYWAGQTEFNVTRFTNIELLNRVDFSKPIHEEFSANIQLTAQQSGTINSVLLSSKVIVDKKESIILGSTFSLNPIIAIPFPERQVKEGDRISIHISYLFGGGFRNLHIRPVD